MMVPYHLSENTQVCSQLNLWNAGWEWFPAASVQIQGMVPYYMCGNGNGSLLDVRKCLEQFLNTCVEMLVMIHCNMCGNAWNSFYYMCNMSVMVL
jgi:hypothetical protein